MNRPKIVMLISHNTLPRLLLRSRDGSEDPCGRNIHVASLASHFATRSWGWKMGRGEREEARSDGLKGSHQSAAWHLGVAGRRGDAPVAESLLDEAEIASQTEQARGQGVPERVG